MIRRCAIYTRKSTEEGLDQAFNSLDAQREACENYIASQKSEGWRVINTHYDDGGLSGGNMERPALKALMTDIDDGRVDIVVVYKVDRLTRSLADFAKLVERFDKHEVSFVSVTQQFNTSNSMGRLTLNVLLSFAQFEREVGAERVRDKIAASRKKGIWTGGPSPLGYVNIDRKLVVNNDEAEIVREIFAIYHKTQSVRAIIEAAVKCGWVTKRRANGKGGKPLSRGPVYHMLKNPIYAGLIKGKDMLYEAQHDAIINRALWENVQKHLAERSQWSGSVKSKTSPLARKLFADGQRLTPSHTRKQGRCYRYYISCANQTDETSKEKRWRLKATDVHSSVSEAVLQWLASPAAVSELAKNSLTAAETHSIKVALREHHDRLATSRLKDRILHIAPFIERVDITETCIEIQMPPKKIFGSNVNIGGVAPRFSITSPVRLKRRGSELRLVLGEMLPNREVDMAAIKLLARAHRWRKKWMSGAGQDFTAIASNDGVDQSTASKQIRLAFLAPNIVEAIIKGAAPIDLTAERLRRLSELPGDWQEQRRLLGFD